MILDGGDVAEIDRAATMLAHGDVVAFPTETVYGLGADAFNQAAVSKIFALKGRPPDHPLIVHVAQSADLAMWTTRLSTLASHLVAQFWPGPLTLILQKATRIPNYATGGQVSIGLRMPSHPVALRLLGSYAGDRPLAGVAAPSANLFGRISPTTAMHVEEEFGASLAVLDGGPCRVGIESTILDLTREMTLGPVLLRPGAITRQMLAEVIGAEPRSVDREDGTTPSVSGSLAAHYAPRTPLRLVQRDALSRATSDVALWLFDDIPRTSGRPSNTLLAPLDPDAYAAALYATLRYLDRLGSREIWLEAPPETPPWEGIWDRLLRARTGSGK